MFVFYIQDTIYCSDYNVCVPLSYLVPDLLLTDLPPSLMLDESVFEFNPKDHSTRLGRGGAGTVHKITSDYLLFYL